MFLLLVFLVFHLSQEYRQHHEHRGVQEVPLALDCHHTLGGQGYLVHPLGLNDPVGPSLQCHCYLVGQ